MDPSIQRDHYDAIVVGGGLAGNLAAALLARAGRRVVLLEQSKRLGGRAGTTVKDGVEFNLGPHALYCHGHAFRLLQELRVPFHGRFPSPGSSVGLYKGRTYRLPTTLSGLLKTRLLSIPEKWQLLRFLREVPQLDTAPLLQMNVRDWVANRFGTGGLASFLFALFRLTSYAAEMEHYSAGEALDQLKIAFAGNVWYVDHGWQSIIDELQRNAAARGAEVRTSAHVTAVRPMESGVAVQLSAGEELTASTAILAVNPQQACALLDAPSTHPLQAWLNTSRPLYGACLDVALTKLTRPQCRFALGLDQPLYASVHSAAAKLGPEGVAVIHVMKYLTSTNESGHHLHELEQMLDHVQPGWRQHVLTRRWLPSMLVANDLPQAAAGGLAGRPAVDATGIRGVFVAGDWAGDRGQLADASAASAERAAQGALQCLQSTAAPRLQYA